MQYHIYIYICITYFQTKKNLPNKQTDQTCCTSLNHALNSCITICWFLLIKSYNIASKVTISVVFIPNINLSQMAFCKTYSHYIAIKSSIPIVECEIKSYLGRHRQPFTTKWGNRREIVRPEQVTMRPSNLSWICPTLEHPPYREDPCIGYLSRFTIRFKVNILCMEHMGVQSRQNRTGRPARASWNNLLFFR